MKTRILSGIVLAIIMISSSFYGGLYLYLLCLGVSLIGMYELYKVINMQKSPMAFVGYLGAILYYLCIITGYEKYDIVTANILADVLIPLTPVICHQMKPGALYITSGILDVKEDVVVKAVKDAGLEVLEVTHQGEWVSVTARKQA